MDKDKKHMDIRRSVIMVTKDEDIRGGITSKGLIRYRPTANLEGKWKPFPDVR